jgi:hypothetical protein
VANETDFRIPVYGKGAVAFGLVPFLSQFVSTATASLPPPNDPLVVAAAEDCGYGMAPGNRILATPAEWNDLLQYLNARFTLVQSLFEKFPPGPGPGVVSKASFAKFLESSEKSPAAFALGMIYSRVATEQWHLVKGLGAPPHRFWHYKVLKHPAVDLSGGGPAWNVDSPDFFVEDAAGAWSVVESKGTLGDIDPERLRAGLTQAYKFANLQLVDPIGSPPVAHAIGDRVCVLTYVDLYGELQVMHLDPPAAASFTERGGPIGLAQAADLVRFDEALSRYAFHSGTDDFEYQSMDAGIIWSSSSHQESFKYGVSGIQARLRAPLRWAVHALSVVVPMAARARSQGMEGPRFSAAVQALASRIARTATKGLNDAELDQDAWRNLSDSLFSYVASVEPAPTWQGLLEHIWTLPLLRTFGPIHRNRETHSLEGLWRALDGTIRKWKRVVVRNQRLQIQLGESSYPQLAITSHGLLVADIDWSKDAHQSPRF